LISEINELNEYFDLRNKICTPVYGVQSFSFVQWSPKL
jgi:hypothetical protein